MQSAGSIVSPNHKRFSETYTDDVSEPKNLSEHTEVLNQQNSLLLPSRWSAVLGVIVPLFGFEGDCDAKEAKNNNLIDCPMRESNNINGMSCYSAVYDFLACAPEPNNAIKFAVSQLKNLFKHKCTEIYKEIEQAPFKLVAFLNAWREYYDLCCTLEAIFYFLSKKMQSSSFRKKITVKTLGLFLFTKNVYQHFVETLFSECTFTFALFRNGVSELQSFLSFREFFLDNLELDTSFEKPTYKDDFVPLYLETFTSFFDNQVAVFTGLDQLRQIDAYCNLLNNEFKLCEALSFPGVDIENELKSVLLTIPFEKPLQKITNTSVLLETENYDVLKKVYFIAKHFDKGIGLLAESISEFASNKFNESVPETKDQKQFLLYIYDKYIEFTSIVNKFTLFDINCVHAVKMAFRKILSSNRSYISTLVSFLHSALQSSKSQSILISSKFIEKIPILLQFCSEVDTFQSMYRKKLAKRLLTRSSYSMELEKSVVSCLKDLFGNIFVNSFEKMFADIDASTTLTNIFFSQMPKTTTKASFDVLSSNYWMIDVSSMTSELVLPEKLQTLQQQYETCYAQRHRGRILRWVSELSTGVLLFGKGQTIIGNAFQCAILLKMAENSENVDFTIDVFRRIISDEIVLVKTLESLINAKVVVCHTAHSSSNEDSANVLLNSNTYSITLPQQSKLNLLQFVRKESTEKQSKNVMEIEKQRKMVLSAAIVRHLKQEKTVTHSDLVSFLRTEVRLFQPSLVSIKNCIEELIEREFIKRDENVQSAYVYIS